MIYRSRKNAFALSLLTFAVGLSACSRDTGNSANATPAPTSLSQVSAVRLNFRYEPDVPGPTEQPPSNLDERSGSIQADFDQNRPQEVLDKTLTSLDKKRVAVIYHRVSDFPSEFRIDMYSPDGHLVRKVTPDTMAVHFPDTILWSPDSSAVAFVAVARAGQGEVITAPTPPDIPNPIANSTVSPAEQTPSATPTPSASTVSVLTFRTEQIYLCDADGASLKPLTQTEGRIYFYYVWSPDSSALAALVSTSPEWASMQAQAQSKKELFVPAGRPRIVEKNGRERLLDDAMTQTRPVWSPGSSKVAVAFDTQIRVYDANGTTPTQASIPLRNQLLISSAAYDKQLEQQAAAENSIANTNDQSNVGSPPATTTLPDPSKLVSFNPIVVLQWTSDDILYFQTGYVKQFDNPAENRSSYLRWHRLIFSPQPVQPVR
jgi:hypothetical protein